MLEKEAVDTTVIYLAGIVIYSCKNSLTLKKNSQQILIKVQKIPQKSYKKGKI